MKAYVVVRPVRRSKRTTSSSSAPARLARYKCPAKVMFVDELPQNIAGKVLRRALR